MLGEPVYLPYLFVKPFEHVGAPVLQSFVRPLIRLHEGVVVALAVIAEDGCGVEDTLGRGYTEAVLHQERIREESHCTTIAVVEGVYPHKAVMR